MAKVETALNHSGSKSTLVTIKGERDSQGRLIGANGIAWKV